MFLVLFYRITVHKYIIEIYVYEPSDKFSEDSRHQPLECSRCVTIPLLHGMADEGAIYCGKRGFPHILWFDAYLFVRVGHIDLRSIFSPSYIHTDLLLIRERCYVFLHIVVPLPSIYDGAKSSRLLENTQHWCCLRDICLFPPSCLLVALYFLSQFWLERIGASRQVVIILLALVDERNLMIYLSERRERGRSSCQDTRRGFHPFLPQVRKDFFFLM